ncbi:Hypothetical protein A7982_05061 [Minicystis rosea]|nr:Hypothetical protein A7982_05061 [Minicystis rosea]
MHDLRWSDIDPTTRAFDPAAARAIAIEHILGACETHGGRAPASRLEPSVLEESIHRALVGAYGVWMAGWRWSKGEPGDGGPLRAWCCAEDSLCWHDPPHAMRSVGRVTAAVAEWRSFLETLASTFATLRASTSGLSIEEGIERAAASLLPMIVARTSAEDAWYATFGTVLGWYLESAGYDPAGFRDAVGTVIGGRFGSWIVPDDDVAREAYAELGREVGRVARPVPPVTSDALAAWIEVRERAFVRPPLSLERDPVTADDHRRFIDGPERARDPERAARMGAALEACRASALRGESLTFERLAAFQSIVLGKEATFRATDAFAKGGRERYGLDDETERRFIAALAEADGAAPVAVRAARAYLDVCFFHPFEDGNARAARLALDHVVTRAGLAVAFAEPLFLLSRSANDEQGAADFAWLVGYYTGPQAMTGGLSP